MKGSSRHPAPTRLTLQGLELAPSQVWGAVRLVPLLRQGAPGDLRLTRRRYGEPLGIVEVAPRVCYASYIPHGLVVDWSEDGTPVAAFGGQLEAPDGKRRLDLVRVMSRRVRREKGSRLRMLPMHLAMEGFLALQFGGPDVAWSEYSREALSGSLRPRVERGVQGRGIAGLGGALRVFEIHERQVGVLLFVADALATAFVVPHPEDYRALHRSLLEDFFGELIERYGALYPHPIPMAAGLDLERIDDFAGLRAGLARMRADWAGFQGWMSAGLLDRPLVSHRVYAMGPFHLSRFRTDLDPQAENHLGEAIHREDGTLEYLKTFRLSAAQTRRAFLLEKLAAHHWNLDATAAALRTPREELLLRLEKAGFGYLLMAHVLAAARKKATGR